MPHRSAPLTYIGGGHALFDAFTRTYGVEFPSSLDQGRYRACQLAALGANLDKGLKALLNASVKGDPDTDVNKVGAFLKNQFISKLDVMKANRSAYRGAKKGQMKAPKR